MTNTPLVRIKDFAKDSPFSEASLRYLKFNQDTNGFGKAGAFLKVGNSVFVHRERFYGEIDRQNGVES